MRASSLPRGGLDRRENLINSGYGTIADTTNPRIMAKNRYFNRDLHTPDISAYNPQEVMRTEGDSRDTPLRGPQFRASVQPYQDVSYNTQQRAETLPAENWEEFITIQGGIANMNEQLRIKEEKVRTMKYREALDQMVHQERKKKQEMLRDYKEPPKRNYEELEALTKLEKWKEQEDKKQYSSDLKQLVVQKNEQKQFEIQKRYQEEYDYQKTRDQVKQYEKFLSTITDPKQKPSFEEYKRMLNQKRREFGDEGMDIAVNDENPRTKVFAGSKYFPDQEADKKKKLEDYIHQSIRQKQEQDALEMLKRKEAHKKMQMETIETINNQAMEKRNRNHKERMDRKEEYQHFLENQMLLGQIDSLKKEHDTRQRQDYLDVLHHQKQARQEARANETVLTTAEKAMNFRRKAPDSMVDNAAMNSLNFNGTCYERNLQLRYIDRWLTKS